MSPIGPLAGVFIPTDRHSGRPRGFAFVTFADSNEGNAAIEKTDQTQLDGRTIRVNVSRPKGAGAPNAMDGPEVKLYVGGLGSMSDEEQLRELFGKYGSIIDVFIPKNRDSGEGRGFGFVTMATPDAKEAMEKLHDSEYNGGTLIVNPSRPKRERRDDRGYGGGGGYGRGGGGYGRDRYDDRRGGYGRDRYDDRRGGGYGGGRDRYDDRGGYDDRGYGGGRDDYRVDATTTGAAATTTGVDATTTEAAATTTGRTAAATGATIATKSFFHFNIPCTRMEHRGGAARKSNSLH